ncbi:VP2 capsid protein [African green monkey polyomavirus]|uniref:Minor capsid protein VP2 n=8 Tax=African green monkey polyomavirus TaxID=12480 RepID=VP2_POVLY|nr:VP2 capsid protein [African green monkey polyomavirus]P04011.3 RecName: Full=Minor capsid protein VP2; AltName: Full=Minor structural protein VP2 [B-lymphotropic polyomavirus]AAA47060.2 VP2 capsid protein [African green monkey polyomavirus]AAA47069.1 VP-2 [Monkey B-lymphotropic papovavirus]
MGGVLSLLFNISEIAAELSLSTGFTVDAILTGEAFAAVSTEAAWLIEIEAVDLAGLSTLEALSLTGLTTEQFSLLSAIPTALNNAIGIGVFFQTVSGASAVVAAGVTTFGYSKEVPVVNMALVPWFPQVDYLFPGFTSFSYYLNAVLDWGESLFHAVGREVWRHLMRQATLQIGQATRAVAVRSTNELSHTLAQIAENARWALTSGPVHIYSSVQDYYRYLPARNPIQLRQEYRNRGEPPPSRADFEYQENREGQRARRELGYDEPRSGQYVEHYTAPGGAHQRVTQDWMLPLILGLYGDITPTWEVELNKLEKEEDGPSKKKARRSMQKNMPYSRSRPQAPSKRRSRGARSKNRA